jgi:hypothetical protein
MDFSRLLEIRKREWGKFYFQAWLMFCVAVFAYTLTNLKFKIYEKDKHLQADLIFNDVGSPVNTEDIDGAGRISSENNR